MSNSLSLRLQPDACLHNLFEAQAHRTPDATAFIHHEQRISYGELNRRANQLARRLQRLGVGPEIRAGILMDRSIHMVIAVLGVLKAGGAYVPLDYKYPIARLAYMIEDAGIRLLLVSSQTADVADRAAPHVVKLDVQCVQTEDAENILTTTAPQNLAYVIYTSGSTGRPKGVGIAHENAVMFVKWAGETFTPAELCGVLASTSLCFDLSVFEIFVPLCHGGYFVLVENALALTTLPNASEVRLLNSVPSVFSELLASEGIPASVRIVNLAGEPFSQSLLRRISQLKTVRRVLNLYGPTECTTYSTFAEIDTERAEKPSIGRPISNTRAYVLDESLAPVELLAEGELYLAGAGVARGYVNRPDFTAERFLPDPFSQAPNQRMYKTGDVVRRLPDNTLEFVGRKDHQVKLRGYRIELGEIESALNSHEQVRDSVVMVRTGPYGDDYLVAYVVSPAGCDTGELRSFLRTRLPEFMVPAAYVVLPKLPLTANGKLDREALPHAVYPERNAPSIAPRTAEESEIAKVFAEVLQVPAVGVTDDFFELGGHSLSAFRIMSRLRETFQLELDPRVLFDSPTVAGMAQTIRQAGAHRASLPDERLRASIRNGRAPLSFTQQRLYFLEKLQTTKPLYNVYAAIHVKGVLDRAVLNRALDEIVRRHESLRTCFPVTNDLPCQQVNPAREVRLRLVDLRPLDQSAQAREVQHIAQRELDDFFDLATGPLLRTQLLRLQNDEHVLLLVTHHIVFDDWSMDVLLGELQAIYEAFAAGRRSPLADLPIQYSHYAVWQRQWMRGERLEAQRSYWRKQLSNLPTPLRLATPTNHDSTPAQHGAQETLTIDSSLGEAVRRLSRSQHVTTFMTLLAAFNVLLYTYTRQEDLLVGTISAGRDEPLTEPLIGCFINTLVLRTRLSGNPTFAELLARVRQVALDAYANQGAPFEKVVDELRRAWAVKDAQLLQVAFGVRNPRPITSGTSSSGVSFSAFEVPIQTARFDLTVWIDEYQHDVCVSWTYATRLFSAQQIRQMHQRYLAVLRLVIANPAVSLRELLAACVETETHVAKPTPVTFVRKEPRPVTMSRL